MILCVCVTGLVSNIKQCSNPNAKIKVQDETDLSAGLRDRLFSLTAANRCELRQHVGRALLFD